jgi:hypothetical protein
MPRRLPIAPRSETPLTPLYARWLDALVGGPSPPEVEATCDDCVMIREPPSDRYDEHARCCTYIPDLPNYLAGGVFANQQRGHGRASLLARVRAGESVTPLGVAMPTTYKHLFDQAWRAFGRAGKLVCPHLADSGLCGIWEHRNAACATHFCRHVRGDAGERFWIQVAHLFAALQTDLASACLLEIGFDTDALAETIAQYTRHEAGVARREGFDKFAVEGIADPEAYARAWGPWKGREIALYEACWEIVSPLSWRDVEARVGPTAKAYARIVARAHNALFSMKLPERLRLGPILVEQLDGEPGKSALSAPGSRELVEADAELLAALQCFRGQRLAAALREVEARGLSFDEAALRRLVDIGVLVRA